MDDAVGDGVGDEDGAGEGDGNGEGDNDGDGDITGNGAGEPEEPHHAPPQLPQLLSVSWHQPEARGALPSSHHDAPEVNGGHPQAEL